MTKLENALVWLFVKTWGKFGEHVIQEKNLWNFGGDDLETVIMQKFGPEGAEIKSLKTERSEAERRAERFLNF